jgi:glycosyltransferase involved in cell wall biosynthesis
MSISMLRIVHFGKYYLPETGGIESVTASLARGAAHAGHRVTVVCFRRGSASDDEVIDGVRVVRAPITRLIASQPLGTRYLRLCLREARDADVIHLHVPNMLGALCCLMVGRRPRLLVHWHSDVIDKGWLGQAFKPLETALLRRADCIVATSSVYAEASPTLQRFRQKITVVPIGVPHPRQPESRDAGFCQTPAELQAMIAGKRLILAVGRLVAYKGFDVLVEAAKDLREDAIVVIVGDGPMRQSLQAKIDAGGLSQQVHLAGRLSDEALHALFSLASVYCLPSLHRAEAFGVVLLEAMSYGLPIVATNIPGSGVPWVNQHGVTGLNVPVGNPKALAQACNRILNSDQEHARLSEGAHRRFAAEFTEEKSIEKTLTTYHCLASN